MDNYVRKIVKEELSKSQFGASSKPASLTQSSEITTAVTILGYFPTASLAIPGGAVQEPFSSNNSRTICGGALKTSISPVTTIPRRSPKTTVQVQGPSTSTSTPRSSCSSKSSKSKRHGSLENRLTNLITKINQNEGGTESIKKKNLKIQVRWMRLDDTKKEIVKPAKGGGFRFIEFNVNENRTFSVLLRKAIDRFFINGKNVYQEDIATLYATILDPLEIELDLSQNIEDYLKDNGLFPSRTCFYLYTEPIKEQNSRPLSPQTDPLVDSIPQSRKRKMCSICFCTYLDDGSECLNCEQVNAFAASLDTDRAKEREKIPDFFESESDDENPGNPVNEPSIDTIRKMRIKAVGEKFLSLENELSELSRKFNLIEPVTFSIRRRHLFKDSMQKMKIYFSNAELKPISVEFISFNATESCIDTGGPSREFFHLLFEGAVNKLLQGPVRNYSFSHNLERLKDNEYFMYGQGIALSLLSNHGAPHQFCNGLSSFVLGMQECFCALEDVPDIDVKQKLHDISDCHDEKQLQCLISEFPERFDYGCFNTVTLENKSSFIKNISHHLIISANIEEIQQFCLGLNCNGLLTILKKYPEESKKLLTYHKGLININDIKTLLRPNFSKNEKEHEKEEDLLFNLYNFLDEVQNAKVEVVKVADINDIEDGASQPREKDVCIDLGDVLRFLTGSPFIFRKDRIDIYFEHNVKRRLNASTCTDKLTIPVSEIYLNADTFSKEIVQDILNSPGFGRV